MQFGAILDMEKELYDQMVDSVMAEQDLLFSISGLAAQLDCLIALAMAAVGKTASFFEFSLCLSRACLGKMIVFIYKWLKNAVFRRS